jgi:hypothetical protein
VTGVQVIAGPSLVLVFLLLLTGEARNSCLICLSGVKALGPAARWRPEVGQKGVEVWTATEPVAFLRSL